MFVINLFYALRAFEFLRRRLRIGGNDRIKRIDSIIEVLNLSNIAVLFSLVGSVDTVPNFESARQASRF